MKMQRIWFVMAACMLLSSCGSGSVDKEAEQDTTPFALSSPLGVFFSSDGGSEAAVQDWENRTQEHIAKCMESEGFEYFPSVPAVSEIVKKRSELTEKEWTEKYGYGISTAFESLTKIQNEDKNFQLTSRLSPEELNVYMTALVGPRLADTSKEPPVKAPPLDEQGCSGQAVIKNGGEMISNELEEFNQEYVSGIEKIANSEEMSGVAGKWSKCMADKKYEFADQDAAKIYISQKYGKATSSLASELSGLTPEERAALFEGTEVDPANLPGIDKAALAAVQKEEIEIAIVDLDCYEKHVAEFFTPLRDQFEKDLIEKHRTQLEEIKKITNR